MVTLEVLIAELNAPMQQPSAAAILELEKSGQLAGQMRVRLATVENQSARLQLGETVPRAVGRTNRPDGGFRGGPGFATYSDVQVGTIVQAISRIEADGTVVTELKVDRSSLTAPRAAGVSNQPVADEPPQVVAQLSLQSTVRMKPGEAVIVGGREAKTAEQSSQTWVVLTAQVPVGIQVPGALPPAAPLGQISPPASAPAPAPISELKVFTLKHASAPDLAPVLANVFAGQPVRFSVDPRTNSLLVIGPAVSLQSAQALVTRLDGN
jgi:type II secretory pathway component GspD/PulD (secretin)